MEVALRKKYRGQLTKLCNSVDEAVNSAENLTDDLSVLCEKIKLLRITLNELNAKISPTVSDDLLESECDKVAEYDINAMDAIASLEVSIKRRTSGNQPQNVGLRDLRAPEDAFPNHERDIGNVQTQNNQKSVRLPKLELIKFNGDLEAWPAFWEQYSQAIHNNPELSINCKFTYLKSLLTGKAAVTISGLTSSQNSYNDAIDLIKSEYGQSERIIDCYVQKLCAIPSVKYDKDVSALRRFYNTASSITCSLESLGISADQYGLMVKSMIFKVLPYSLRVQFNKIKLQNAANEVESMNGSESDSVSGDPDSVNYKKQIADLLNFIKIEVDALEQAQRNENKDSKFHGNSRENFSHSSRNEPRNRLKQSSDERFTAQGLLNVANNQCLFCKNKNHLTKNCLSTFISLTDKKKLLQDCNRCFRCTEQNHRSKFCKTKDITCKKCKGRHVTALCDPSFKPKNKNDTQNEQNDRANNEHSTVTAFSTGRLENVYLQTACVFVKSYEDNNEIFLRAVFDAGSQLTYIKQCVSRELNLPIIGKHKISVCVFGSSQRGVAKLCNKVEVVVRSQYINKLITIHAIEVPEICFDSIKPPCLTDPIIEDFAKQNPLADIRSTPLNSTGISLLIGSDNYWLLVTGETRPLTDTLRAINTEVGWTIHGARESNDIAPKFSVNLSAATVLHSQIIESDIGTDFNEIDNLNVKRFWDLETIGISGSEVKPKDNFTENFMKNNVKFKDNRYEVSLPWQSDKILDSNYSAAFVRVKSLINKLCKNGTLLEYDRAIREYERLGCLELVNENYVNQNKTYYLPHRPVYRRDKDTSQVRVVFDASAHAPGLPSLNDKLITGENLVPDLLNILLNFRIGSVGLVADIEKAFLQISLCNDDRDYHRFLWFKNPIENEITSIDQLPKLDTFRMCRVTFGVTTSPFLLAVTLRKHLLNQPDRKFGKYLLESFYIDDFVKSVQNEDVALEVYDRSRNILAEANMNLRKWCSNNAKLMKTFNNLKKADTYNLKSNDPKKVLGINWFTITDQLAVDIPRIFNNLDLSKEPTKRTILQTIGKVFDPIGMLVGCTITVKILLQKIWKENLKWDELLPNEFKMEWKQWINDVSNLNDYAVPRCILPDRKIPVELHIFADASPQAYGVVAYLKRLDNDASNFLMAKNRVAPLNQTLTLPKLELTAALCAARLQKYIIENIELNITEIFIWSDSKITLHWINGNKHKWKPFIQNRVQEMRNMKNIIWKYCPGKENPADLLTRGVQASKLLKESERWLHGPTWLSSSKENWPRDEYFDLKDEEATVLNCLAETREKIVIENNERATLKEIFSLDQYSSYEKTLRVTALVYRFLNNAKIKEKERRISGYIRTKEMEKAEIYWIRIAQEEQYFEEIKRLKQNKEISKKSKILKLNPFIDENNMLRLKGRLQESFLNYNERHPIILPKRSELGKKLIWSAHEQMKHSGINSTLANIRKRYWIIQARQRIKAIISRCVVCKKLKGKSGMQPFAPLPRDRITTAQPFEVTGIDFAGPLYIIKEEKRRKVYIMLFTCAVVRAVHLELVESLSTESCVFGLRRFIARRGVPSIIYSDNAKTFKRTALELDELTKILQQKEIQDLARKNRIHWKFSVERGSWWGGFWERLVRTVKGALKSTLLKKLFEFDELRTILAEVEATVNSRPLTYIDDDPENLFILTPGKFLIGEADLGFSPNLKSKEITKNEILKIWKNREQTMSQFWKKWQVDYLQQLRSAHYIDNPKSKEIKVDDVVLLQDQDKPRLTWKLVRVTQAFQGRDGKVRACEIKTSNGDRLKRPVQCLYPLEIDSFAAAEDVENKAN